MKLAILLPYRDHQSARAAAAVLGAVVSGVAWFHRHGVPVDVGIFTHYRSHVHIARLELAKQAIEWKADVVVWFDDDAVPPPDLFERLWPHLSTYDIVIPFFTTRDEPPVSVTWEARWGEPRDRVIPLEKVRRIEAADPPQVVHTSGLHTAIMRGEVLSAVMEVSSGNPFQYTPRVGEDGCFFFMAANAKKTVFCDTTVKVGHVGEKVYGEAVE